MSTNLQQIGTPLLDMDGIATQLHIKGPLVGITEDNEEQFSPFITLKDINEAGTKDALIQYIGKDDEGEPVNMKKFALAYFPDGMQLKDIDRNKVNDSEHLHGCSIDHFYTTEEGSAVEDHIIALIKNFNDEIKDLRAQQVQLFQMIAKKSLVDCYRPWNGFYDTFREAYPVHQKGYVATAFVDSPTQNVIRVKTGEQENFAVGDYVVVVSGTDLNDDLNRSILRVTKISGTTITFDGYTQFPIKADTTHLYKSFGMSKQNSFLFGHYTEQGAAASSLYTGLDDDNYRTRKKIKANNTGYATTFRINPNRASGLSDYYLSTIDISVRKVGNPGSLMCYVINAADISKWEDPQQAADTGILLAKSKPLVVENKTGDTIVSFDFMDDLGQYALLENIDQGLDNDAGRTRFCMIIEALTADSTNYYEVLFLQHYNNTTEELTDLQLNNIVYEYSETPNSELMSTDNFSPLVTNADINNADLFYGITLRPVQYSTFSPHNEGLYSAEFKTYEPIKVNNIRLNLRVAREGYFTVSQTSASTLGNVTDGGTINFVEDKNFRQLAEQYMEVEGFSSVTDTVNGGTRKVIIGDNITEVSATTKGSMSIKKGGHINIGDPVYPMGYYAWLLCSHKYWDELTQTYQTDSNTKRISIPISCVQPSYHESERDAMIDIINDPDVDSVVKNRLMDKMRISDNLIFEADIDNDNYYNHFQLQIYWKGMASHSIQSFAGRIYDLSISLNRKMF